MKRLGGIVSMLKHRLAITLVTVLMPAVVLAQDPQPSPQDPDQKPPAAVGEEPAKPTRGFFSALVHNLGDDVKHIPRRNSVYWLAAGAGMALAIHPADDYINEHMRGSGFANT